MKKPIEQAKPKPKLDLSLPKETHEQRVKEAAITETDIVACKNFVADMKEAGIYKNGKKVEKISPAQVRKFFNSGTEGVE